MKREVIEKGSKRKLMRRNIMKVIFLTIGALIMAVGLEMALIPNNLIDGGITGISIMLSNKTNLPLGLLLFILNLPFLYLGYKQIGMRFALSAAYGIVVLSISASLLHHSEPFTEDILIATVVGGVLIGIGVGIAIRAGGVLDGSETLAILINKKVPFSVGQIILFMNLFILGTAALVFGLDRAMYSFMAYFIAFKVIDMVTEGFEQSRSVWIITDESRVIGERILKELGRGVTYIAGEGAFTNETKQVIFCVINHLEESKLKDIVEDEDKGAFLAFGHVSEIQGGNFKKKDIH